MSDYVVTQTGCWEWTGKRQNGYGSIQVPCAPVMRGDHIRRTKTQYAHIYYFEIYKGGVPDGLELDHVCRNKLCVNPDHLEAVSHAENNRRGNGTKLTADQVSEIRALVANGETRAAVAKRFGVSAPHVSRIASGKWWKGVEPAVPKQKQGKAVRSEHTVLQFALPSAGDLDAFVSEKHIAELTQ